VIGVHEIILSDILLQRHFHIDVLNRNKMGVWIFYKV
jgi:hypothetical protein